MNNKVTLCQYCRTPGRDFYRGRGNKNTVDVISGAHEYITWKINHTRTTNTHKWRKYLTTSQCKVCGCRQSETRPEGTANGMCMIKLNPDIKNGAQYSIISKTSAHNFIQFDPLVTAMSYLRE